MSPITCIGSVRSTFQDKQASALACLFLASKPVSLLLCEAFFEHQNVKKKGHGVLFW
ncbi:Hypothetical protein M6_Spy0375 [Streptococcus pyogenes MGAS10394]|nr:Hypothetical protein M6_Spy0375 [Streptococcus pyogenes MGAS10394]